jgi:hypothetical protein
MRRLRWCDNGKEVGSMGQNSRPTRGQNEITPPSATEKRGELRGKENKGNETDQLTPLGQALLQFPFPLFDWWLTARCFQVFF